MTSTSMTMPRRPMQCRPMQRGPMQCRKSARGYTMVEVMMGLAILAVGSSAIVALQRFAVMGSMTSRHVSNATNVAASVIETMNAESSLWSQNAIGPTDVTAMPWLGTALEAADAAQEGDWVAPDRRGFTVDGTAVDATVATDIDLTPVAYCTHVRAAWVGNQTESAVGLKDSTDAARVEVRTFYAKSGRPVASECAQWTGQDVETLILGTPMPANGILRSRAEYGVIYLTTIVRRNAL